jgi:hypothetical protein
LFSGASSFRAIAFFFFFFFLWGISGWLELQNIVPRGTFSDSYKQFKAKDYGKRI